MLGGLEDQSESVVQPRKACRCAAVGETRQGEVGRRVVVTIVSTGIGRSSLWTASCCWGGWLVLLLRGCNSCRTVGGGLQSGAALIGVRLDVGSLPPRSSSLTVTGCSIRKKHVK